MEERNEVKSSAARGLASRNGLEAIAKNVPRRKRAFPFRPMSFRIIEGECQRQAALRSAEVFLGDLEHRGHGCVGIRVDNKMRDQLQHCAPRDKLYFDGSDPRYLQVIRAVEDSFIGKPSTPARRPSPWTTSSATSCPS